MDLLEKDEKRWIRKYLNGEDVDFKNSGMLFGSKVAEHLESQEETEDLELSAIKTNLPRLEISEFALNCILKLKDGEIELTARMDTANKILDAFREYKTGRGNAWNQKKAQEHGQLHFYATIIYILTRKIPTCWLDWIETEEVDGVVRATGNIYPFEVKITLLDILKMKNRIAKNARRIDQLVRESLETL